MKRTLSALAGAGLMMTLAAATGYSAETKNTAIIAKGKAIFEENCVACHQSEGSGMPGTAPALNNKELQHYASDRFLIATITAGREDTPMPAFGDQLKADGVKAVVAYLRTLAVVPNVGNQVDKEPGARGDILLGQERFQQICSSCHGNDGEGYIAGGSGTAIGKPGFLSKASDGFIRATVREGRSNTPMHGFVGPSGLANLSPQEIDGIISYLRSRHAK